MVQSYPSKIAALPRRCEPIAWVEATRTFLLQCRVFPISAVVRITSVGRRSNCHGRKSRTHSNESSSMSKSDSSRPHTRPAMSMLATLKTTTSGDYRRLQGWALNIIHDKLEILESLWNRITLTSMRPSVMYEALLGKIANGPRLEQLPLPSLEMLELLWNRIVLASMHPSLIYEALMERVANYPRLEQSLHSPKLEIPGAWQNCDDDCTEAEEVSTRRASTRKDRCPSCSADFEDKELFPTSSVIRKEYTL